MTDYEKGFAAAQRIVLGYLDRSLAWAGAMPDDADSPAIARILPPLRAEVLALRPGAHR